MDFSMLKNDLIAAGDKIGKILGEANLTQSDSAKDLGSKVVNTAAAISQSILKTVTVSRRRSSKTWINLLDLGILNSNNAAGRGNLYEALYDGFTVLGTNDSTFNETISNEYGQNRFQQAAEDIASKVKESALGEAASLVGNFYRSYDSANGLTGADRTDKLHFRRAAGYGKVE